MATLDEFRNQTGEFAEEPAAEHDADAPDVEQPDPAEEYEDISEDTPHDGDSEIDTDAYEPEEPELSPKEKTAFEKRLEREKRKLEETLSKQYEDKYSKHKRVIEQLGGDPDVIELRLKEQQIMNEAQQLAEQNGWDEQQYSWYIGQQQQVMKQEQLQKELAELRIANQINDLRDNPEFAGIQTMRQEISDIVNRSNGTLSVEQAYWALGGAKRNQQTKREAEQRAAVQRRQRVVANDAPAAASTEKALPPDVLAQAAAMGMSPAEVRELMAFEGINNINDYRKIKKK
ncbi:hypothetical protein AMQ84_27225 [Paenibacillus riograndensis]|uniref:Uncharacterized protein n=1 Tax=Paenibacillus riograndensis TaxID=483937 RepID=A0A132TKM9_9BACL|nr:hypothetical protein [Paenibacillus riograndensis]KWX71616.1 hypothetical protein AMQ84_27225 [Paenibacillus riograndensis]